MERHSYCGVWGDLSDAYFYKMFMLGNQVKFRYFTQCLCNKQLIKSGDPQQVFAIKVLSKKLLHQKILKYTSSCQICRKFCRICPQFFKRFYPSFFSYSLFSKMCHHPSTAPQEKTLSPINEQHKVYNMLIFLILMVPRTKNSDPYSYCHDLYLLQK